MGHPTVPGRSCGACSYCCKLLLIEDLNKPSHQWCEHCRPGRGGCSIYETRPKVCQGFACGWLMSSNVSDDWYPLRSHMVLSLAPLNGILTCVAVVDRAHQNIWRQEPYYSQLKTMAYNGLHVKRLRDVLLVNVRYGDKVWLLTDKEDIDISRLFYVVKLVATGEYAVELFETQEQASSRVSELTGRPQRGASAAPGPG